MSIIGEHRSAMTAAKLEKIILTAMNDRRWGDVRSAVSGFAREELVEWYYEECGDSYGIHAPHPDILKRYPSKEN